MSKIAIVTDSTAYIPLDVMKGLPISVVPLQVVWGSESLRDGIDITPQQFYARLKTAKVMPTTSQPSPAAFKEIYDRLLAEGYEILSIHISGKLSGTMDSATQARNSLPGAPIELVDSDSVAMAMGFQVLNTARAAAQGASLRECKALAVQAITHIGALFAVSTLEFLRRGGRIGGAAAFLGTALDLKPILELKDGHVEALERVRTMSKVVDRLLELLQQRVGSQKVHLASIHAAVPDQAQALMEKARQFFPAGQIVEEVISDVSPVIGTQTGPGTLAVTWMAGM